MGSHWAIRRYRQYTCKDTGLPCSGKALPGAVKLQMHSRPGRRNRWACARAIVPAELSGAADETCPTTVSRLRRLKGRSRTAYYADWLVLGEIGCLAELRKCQCRQALAYRRGSNSFANRRLSNPNLLSLSTASPPRPLQYPSNSLPTRYRR